MRTALLRPQSSDAGFVEAGLGLVVRRLRYDDTTSARMTEDMRVRNLAENTQMSYVQQVSLFARHFDKSPEQLGPEDIRAYQVYLTKFRKDGR
jgi:hypothetical protein